MDDIKTLREEINLIDKDMARLFEKRMAVSKKIAIYKGENNLPIFDIDREKEVIERCKGYIEDKSLENYYVNFQFDVMKLSRKYQEALLSGKKVAYCGTFGAYAYIAANKMYTDPSLVAYSTFKYAFDSVSNGECDACVLPIENSYAGDVGEVMDLIFQGNLYVNNILELEIVHNLLVNKGTKIENIKTVISHPQAISQCQEFLSRYEFDVKEEANTAIAAKKLALSGRDDIAVIASSETAKIFNLEILKEKINDSNTNTTRFASFSNTLNATEGNHFIIVFTVKNEAGALARCLDIIGAHNFNMKNLRSRPLKNLMWTYYFFVELEGNLNTQDAKDMLLALKAFCDKLKVVGSYKL